MYLLFFTVFRLTLFPSTTLIDGFYNPDGVCSLRRPNGIRKAKYFGLTLFRKRRGHKNQNTPIHNILSTASQLSISQKALGMLPEDGNVMPKHVGATIHNE
jgi:hypothetical protein